jgi:hypothetical protein
MKAKRIPNYRSYRAMYNEMGYLMSREELSSIIRDKSSRSMVENVAQIVYRLLLILAIVLFPGSAAYAEPSNQSEDNYVNTPEIRVLAAISKFTGTKQVALAFAVPISSWLYSNRVEIATGSIGNSDDTTAFLSIDPLSC